MAQRQEIESGSSSKQIDTLTGTVSTRVLIRRKRLHRLSDKLYVCVYLREFGRKNIISLG